MESLDDLLNFSSEEEDDDKLLENFIPSFFPSPNGRRRRRRHQLASPLLDSDDLSRSSPEFVEEELEWISNKDAFPSVETFVNILAEQAGDISKHYSPVSVLENSTSSSNSSTIMNYCGSLQVPVRPRSKCRRKRVVDVSSQQFLWSQECVKNCKPPVTGAVIGRKCQHCGAEKTPQWRAGPQGPKTLCNACGVRYKSGRLCPEYRPASSPTFSSKLHSNSHRKIMEMKKMKNCETTMMAKSVDKG